MADAQLIQGTVTSLGKTVSEREVLDLPLNGRNFTQLGLLQPGVVPLTPGLAEAGGSLRAGQAYAVNGQRPESNNFLIDGANNFNGVDGGFVLKPPVDAITEFRILTHNASAEFGQSLGSTTNIITRSGTNRFHGALWEFLRNDVFDATNYFAATTEPLKQNQFGGTFGGPIRKDKTFFFAYYEGFRNRQGETTSSTVPSVAEREWRLLGDLPGRIHGGFCNNPESPAVQCFSQHALSQQPAPVAAQSIRFPQNLLQYFPLPNTGPNVFTSTQIVRQDSNQGGVKIDHYLTPSDILNFRYSISDGTQFNPIPTSGASVPGFPVGQDQRAQNFVAQETHTFSPSMIGVFRFSYLRNKFLFGQHINHTTPAELGFGYDPSLDMAVGPPSIQVAGYTTIGDPITGPRNTYENAFDVLRLAELGARPSRIQIRRRIPAPAGQRAAGHRHQRFLCFCRLFRSCPMRLPASCLVSRSSFCRAWVISNAASGEMQSNSYVQDTFKATSRLTFNLGLRYDLPFPYTEIKNRQTLWVPGRQSTVMPDAPPGLLYPGDKGVPAGLDPHVQEGIRAAGRRRLGSDRQRQVAGHVGLRNFL